MLLLAVVQLPAAPDARAAAARLLGLALAEVNQRLAGPLPRVLLTITGSDGAETQVRALEQIGFTVVTLDPTLVPDDSQRVVARRVEVSNDVLAVFDRNGTPHRCPGRGITLLQRGLRHEATSRKVTVSERHLDVKKALLTGGLLLTKKVEHTKVKTTETDESFVLVERDDGAPDVMLYERQLDYRFLGSEMAPSSRSNLERVYAKLRAIAPSAATDDRLLRPGFVSGLPNTSADPIDLALALVTLARRKLPTAG